MKEGLIQKIRGSVCDWFDGQAAFTQYLVKFAFTRGKPPVNLFYRVLSWSRLAVDHWQVDP